MKRTKDFKRPVARQLPSGSWFCRVRVGGKDIPITKDTPEEAEAEAMAIKYGIIESKSKENIKKKTLADALDEYISKRDGLISPATIRAYKSYRKNRFQSMMQCDVFSTTDAQWQAAVKREFRGLSPKYAKNVWSLVSPAIEEATGKKVNVILPGQVKNERSFLDPDQVLVFVDAIKGRSAEIPALLELSSMRCSEMLALKWEDVDLKHNVIYIRGARVRNSDGDLVHKKQNKNDTSRRSIPIIPPLKEALEKVENRSGYVVKLKGDAVFKQVNRVCVENGLPPVGNHGLRHSFASLAYHLGMPEKVAMEIGGWKDPEVMHKIYTHISQKYIAERAQQFSDFFNSSSNNPKKDNENSNT